MRFAACLMLASTVACARVEDATPRVPEAWETAAGSRLHPIFVTHPSGARSFVAFEDRARGERCTPSYAPGGARCVPAPLQAAAYADEHCTMPTVALDQTCDDTPKLVRVESGVFEGKPVARAYTNRGAACEPLEPPTGARFIAATEERVTDADFVLFEPRALDVGARLRVNMLIGTDGSRYYTGLHDSALDVDCGFETAADGVVRCLPHPVATAFDETCTHRVVGYAAGTPPPRAVTLPRSADARCELPRVFRATDVGVIQRMTIDSTGKCVPQTTPPTRWSAVRVEEELPPENFEPEVRVRVGDGRITQWIRTIGSARLPSTIEDRDLGTNCRFGLDDGAYRCFPEERLLAPGMLVFPDASCTDPLVCASAGCGETRRFVFETVSTCKTNVRKVGTAIAAPPAVFGKGSDVCAPYAGVTCAAYHDAGTIVPTSEFASGTVIVE